mmetsp:Transcript_56006/g.155971  ORF Transcript_56006/g.155971 Transcript_56006/m.155971 type:complete len:234 (+) Transcript_56006:637-1338(+)
MPQLAESVPLGLHLLVVHAERSEEDGEAAPRPLEVGDEVEQGGERVVRHALDPSGLHLWGPAELRGQLHLLHGELQQFVHLLLGEPVDEAERLHRLLPGSLVLDSRLAELRVVHERVPSRADVVRRGEARRLAARPLPHRLVAVRPDAAPEELGDALADAVLGVLQLDAVGLQDRLVHVEVDQQRRLPVGGPEALLRAGGALRVRGARVARLAARARKQGGERHLERAGCPRV